MHFLVKKIMWKFFCGKIEKLLEGVFGTIDTAGEND